ncbi:MAG: Ca-activated chloride channel [Acidobacteriota bacterium]|jgi:Ca-activated chloride channel family protein|nr:Ca-activated chloride channel [Acidobacteriota bacterium]
MIHENDDEIHIRAIPALLRNGHPVHTMRLDSHDIAAAAVQSLPSGNEEGTMKRIAATFMLLLYVACTARDTTKIVSTVSLGGANPAAIRGKVTTGGNPLPGTTVTLTPPRGASHTAVTDVNGEYTFVSLAPGRYRLRFELSGLAMVMKEVTIAATSVLRLETDLHVNSVAESITVTAEAPSVMETMSVGFSSSQMKGGSSGYTPPRSAPSPSSYSPPPMYIQDTVQEASRFTQFKENEFIAAAKEATTTFAIDVDRASYANVRRYLTANQLPPTDAVRIEEMVNYFTYHYAPPADGRPFAVSSEVVGCPWEPAHRLVRIGIQGQQIEQWRQAPNNLVFLLDVSGSMQPIDRLPLIKSALRMLVDQLRVQDSVAIVVYAGAAGLVLPPTSGADKAKIVNALDALQAGGSTAGGEGIELAYKVARDNFNAQGNNRVILATDGDFNVGVNDTPSLQKLIEEKRATGVFLTCVGVGSGFNDELMKTLSVKGNGNYSYLDSLAEAKKTFVNELGGTLVAIAKDVKVQLEFDPALVESYRQIGYEMRALANADFKDDTKDAGELGSGHSVTALYEIVPTHATIGRIATLRLRYKEPKGETSSLIESTIVDEGKNAYEASPDTQFAAAVAELGMLLRGSKFKGHATYADALALARAMRGEDFEGYREELLRMIETSKSLSGEGAQVALKQ